MDREHTYLCRLFKNREYIKAIKYTSNGIKRDSNDEIIYICYILVNIYNVEEQNGIQSHIFSSFEFYDNLSEIKDFYQNIKFLIRRFEYDLDKNSKKQAIKYFKDMKISGIALYFITRYACVDKENVLNSLILACEENNMHDVSRQIKIMLEC